jgi:hypothetical protein
MPPNKGHPQSFTAIVNMEQAINGAYAPVETGHELAPTELQGNGQTTSNS